MSSTSFCNITRISTQGQWFLSMAMGGAIALSANCVSAQIIPDSTLPNNSIVPRDCTNCEITGGTKVGENLFHSFTEFSVSTGGTAYFNNAVDIQNIISRVTGKSVSSIDGLIRANHTANLFILNPNGIIFGQNAQLNIGGSFVASTANSFRFSDGSEFSAINPQAPPLLVVNIIPGLQYGLTQAESQISNAGQLAVAESKSLILHTGTVTSTGSLIAPGGTITLEAEGNISTGGILTGSSPELTFIQSGGAISLISHDGEINTTAGVLNSGSLVNGGAITLQAEGNITTGNILSAIIPRENDDSLTSLTQNGGAISLISHDGEINTTAGVLNSGSLVNGGAVNLQAKGNIITGDILTSIPTKSPPFTFTQNGRAISLISRDGEINTTAGSLISRADNQGGTIFLNAQGNIGIFSLDTSANKDGGNIDIISNANIFTTVDGDIKTETQGLGKSGDITITSRSLVVQGGTRVSASTKSPGKGGNLTIRARDSVEIIGVSPTRKERNNNSSNSSLFTLIDSPTQKEGNSKKIATGGDLTIDTKQLIVRDGGQISTGGSVGSTGNAGKLTIQAEFVEVSGVAPPGFAGMYPFSSIVTGTQGASNGGNLFIDTKRLIIRDGANVVSGTINTGNAGDITIHAELVEITGGSAERKLNSVLSVDTTGVGKVGNLKLTTGKLILSNGGAISASTNGAKPGGNISIEANSLLASGTFNGFDSGVYAQTFADGQGGNVKIKTGELTVSDDATISVASGSIKDTQVPLGILQYVPPSNNTSKGDAGNLEITANSIRLNNKASILAITASGNGGNVKLNLKDLLLLRNNSQISSSAGTKLTGGNGGNITINSRNSPSGFIVAVPNEHSNITANAFNDKGGRVEIYVTRIFGLKVLSREDLIRLSGKNDLTQLNLQQFPSSITAISQTKPDLDGQIILKIPDIDPSRGLVQLPTNLVDASQKIDTGCNVGGKQRKSSFVITGRGGLPPQPGEALRTESVIVNGVAAEQNPSASVNFTPDSTNRIVEAQGWVVNSLGEITLTAYPTSVTPPQNFQSTPATCHAS